MTSPKQTRVKTSRGVAKRIMRMAEREFAISVRDIMDTFDFTLRHARRYLDWMQQEEMIYLRYRSRRTGYYYYSVVRKKRNETRKV